jgi:hypothetical protein
VCKKERGGAVIVLMWRSKGRNHSSIAADC